MKFKGVIFDMDGTLTIPVIDFQKLRKELNIPKGEDIAKTIKSWPDEKKRDDAWKLIEHYEDVLANQNRLHPGVEDAFEKFQRHGIKLAILTRNTSRSVEKFLEKFGLHVDFFLARDFEFIKPSPEPIMHILEQWQLNPEDCLMVGDYIHDIECGIAAGTSTCFFHNDGYESFEKHADYSAKSYEELERIILN